MEDYPEFKLTHYRLVAYLASIHINMISLHIESYALMRTNIDIDDQLMRQAMRSSGARTKKATVEAGLRLLVETHAQRTITRLRGKVQWQGDLNQSRLSRVRTQA